MYQGFPKMRGPLFDKNVRKADLVHMEVTPGFEPGNQGFADPCLTTWLCHRRYIYIICRPFEKVHTFFK